MLPVMVGALISMLEGLPALKYLYIGFPVALLLAAIWTSINTQRTLAEIHLRPGAIAVRSTLAAASPPDELHWYRLLDIRGSNSELKITVGYDIYHVEREFWPDFESLKSELAKTLYQSQDLQDI